VTAQLQKSSNSGRAIRALCLLISLFCAFNDSRDIVAAQQSPFATFNVDVEIDIEDGEIDMTATFSLGAASDALDLVKDAVSLQVTGGKGAYAVTIPPGRFKPDRKGGFVFQGRIDRVKIEAALRPARSGVYEFEIETESANLRGFSNPVTVVLAVGDHVGNKSVKAKIE
jgi:hypothetical protein